MSNFVLRHAAQVVSLAGDPGPRAGAAMSELSIVENAAVVVSGGKIAWVGPDAELTVGIAGDEAREIDCHGHAVIPAFVDSHTHLVWAGDRLDELELRLGGADYEQIFAAGGGILSSVRQTRAASEDELYAQSRRRIARMRRCGATTFEIKSGYGLDLETELRQLRVARRLADDGFRIKTTCLAAHAIPAEARGSEEARVAFVDRVCDEILPAVVEAGLADYCDVFCDRGAFTEAESRQVLRKAVSLGLALRVHANEFGHTGGAVLAAELGAKSADHLLHLDAHERSLLRETGVVATLLPGTSTVLGKPFADGRALVEDGVPIAVATDCNPGSCAFESLAMVLALACYGNGLSPAEALCGATHNAAVSLGVAERVGRIAPGLDADLLILDASDYRELVYHAGSPLVHQVFSRGVRVDRSA